MLTFSTNLEHQCFYIILKIGLKIRPLNPPIATCKPSTSTTKECTTPKEQENDSTLMPPPMSPTRLTVSMEPRSAPVHLHLTMILRKLFDHPTVIPPFINDRLTAPSLVGPLQTVYRGVCMLQDKLHVTKTNVNCYVRYLSTSLLMFSIIFPRYNRSTTNSQNLIQGGKEV